MFHHPLVIRYDPRDGGTVEEIKEHIPSEIRVTRTKQQPQYKFDCMEGREHPLRLEVDNYVLTTVHTTNINSQASASAPGELHRRYQFSVAELELISLVQSMPEVEWAIENSFDGIYVCKEDDYTRFESQYKFAVYLKSEQATFWRLKYHGK